MKSNKTYQPPSGKADILYLVCIALFALAALLFDHPKLAAAEGAVFLVLGFLIFGNLKRRFSEVI